ncbi:6281_t:CDS:1 [Acaulospora morrowiae]|uniref:6281_t:CDS:1 n=1 Tax=Acaulospora morrowiae TaxID=94023 RepID=A0A9N9E231_9GLOM|nr:6281_t:CDS:1 [Acaulospora morrowiae]
MTSFKSFNFYLAFLAFFLLTFIQANHAEEETFTQEYIRTHKLLVEKITYNNPYLNAIANGTAKDSAFINDIVQSHNWLVLWARSVGYALTRAPIPPPKDWGLGDAPPEFFIDFLAGIMNQIEGYGAILKNLAVEHNFDIYGKPISAAAKADGDYFIKVAKTLPFEAFVAENWAGIRFIYDGFSVVQKSIKQNGYKYAFQDYIDIFTSPSFKNSSDQLELLTNTIFKSKSANRKIATKVISDHIGNDYEVLADNVN